MSLRRRAFLQRALLGCAGFLGLGSLGLGSLGLETESRAPQLQAALARRVVRLAAAPVLTTACSVALPQLLADVFEPTDFAALLSLDDAALQARIAERIRLDYRAGALRLHQGWWLARSEIALLQLATLAQRSAWAAHD